MRVVIVCTVITRIIDEKYYYAKNMYDCIAIYRNEFHLYTISSFECLECFRRKSRYLLANQICNIMNIQFIIRTKQQALLKKYLKKKKVYRFFVGNEIFKILKLTFF